MDMEDKPIREIQPVVVPAQYFVWGPLISAFLSLFLGVFGFVISNMIIGPGKDFEHVREGPVTTFGITAFMISFVILMILIGIKVFNEPS
jgi:membrane-associated phospholipid phosphatase